MLSHALRAEVQNTTIPLVINYQGRIRTATSTQTQTLTNFSLGTAAASRKVYVAVHSVRNNSGGVVTSATIGGVTATCWTLRSATSGNNQFSICQSMFAADVPSGTTGTIVATFSGGSLFNTPTFTVYSVYNQSGTVATAYNTQTLTYNTSATVATVTTTIGTVNGGFVLHMFGSFDQQTNPTVTNAVRSFTGLDNRHNAVTAVTDGSTLSCLWNPSVTTYNISSAISFKP
jgi:hypothetical protein